LNILIFDTATTLETVILHSGKETLMVSEPVASGHAATLFTNIGSLFEKAGLSMKDIEALAVGTGPGSFTGARIAVSTARMLAQIHSIPLVGMKTHDMYALSVSAEYPSQILVAFDAKKNRVFGALYRRESGTADPAVILPPGDYPVEGLISACDMSAPLYSAGDGALRYRDELLAAVRDLRELPDFRPDGEKIAQAVMSELKKNAHRHYSEVVPFYARKSDAEIAKEGL
jgi:tRNA threonylcarbamoyladenosine biosynthesis protein TsaB